MGGKAAGSTDGVGHHPLITESLVPRALLVFSHMLSLEDLPLFDQLGSQSLVQLARILLELPSVLIFQIFLFCSLVLQEFHLFAERHETERI